MGRAAEIAGLMQDVAKLKADLRDAHDAYVRAKVMCAEAVYQRHGNDYKLVGGSEDRRDHVFAKAEYDDDDVQATLRYYRELQLTVDLAQARLDGLQSLAQEEWQQTNVD